MCRAIVLPVTLALMSVMVTVSLGLESKLPNLLISQPTSVHFDMSAGRLLATSTRLRQNRQTITRVNAAGCSERLTIAIDRGLLSVRYQMSGDGQKVSITVIRRDQVEIRWERSPQAGELVTTVFSQPGQGQVEMVVEATNQSAQKFSAASLWHLLLTHETACSKHLIPVLKAIRPNWNVLRELEEIRSTMLSNHNHGHRFSRQDVLAKIEQLGSSSFRERRTADRQLRSMGRGIHVFLDDLDPETLDTEQQLRIAQISRAMQQGIVDTPQRVAAWLANDHTAWLALMAGTSAAQRRQAAARLAALCCHSVEFDPDAPEPVRITQIAGLRSKLVKR